jgi:hypothetical protein
MMTRQQVSSQLLAYLNNLLTLAWRQDIAHQAQTARG